jgi:hypothetical protein
MKLRINPVDCERDMIQRSGTQFVANNESIVCGFKFTPKKSFAQKELAVR